MPSPAPLPRSRALYRARELRALDRAASERFGIPGITLMERAAAAVHEKSAMSFSIIYSPRNPAKRHQYISIRIWVWE